MRFKSLAFRLFVTALGWTMVVLPTAGFIVYSMYAREAFQSFDDRIAFLLSVVLVWVLVGSVLRRRRRVR